MNKIPIIYYHSVGLKNPAWNRNFLTLELPFFEDQLKYFKKKFRVISLQDYFLIRKGEKETVSNALVLTFDDGYLDNWCWAYPLLKKYSLPATIFISPEFVDPRSIVRPNLEDVWQGRAQMSDLQQWGFLSWDEMRKMEESGLISIESHTMTHTKYVVSDRLTGFHHPGADSVYTIANLFPERKPYYIEDLEFDQLIPNGFPLFEMQSSVIAQKVEINPEFNEYCIQALRDYDFENYKFPEAFDKVKGKYLELKNKKKLIIRVENGKDFEERVRHEVFESKRIIEEKLNKTVDFLCWPHGDNNQQVHHLAIDAGYKATMWGKTRPAPDNLQRIPARIGTSAFRNSRFLTLQRTKFIIGRFQNKFLYRFISLIYSILPFKLK